MPARRPCSNSSLPSAVREKQGRQQPGPPGLAGRRRGLLSEDTKYPKPSRLPQAVESARAVRRTPDSLQPRQGYVEMKTSPRQTGSSRAEGPDGTTSGNKTIDYTLSTPPDGEIPEVPSGEIRDMLKEDTQKPAGGGSARRRHPVPAEILRELHGGDDETPRRPSRISRSSSRTSTASSNRRTGVSRASLPRRTRCGTTWKRSWRA